MTKIVELRASNFARLSAVTIRPDGALVQITGKNSAGKTSCLHAIWVALKGRAVAPPKPIRAGAEEARLQVDLGTMLVTRTFKRVKNDEVTSDLKVTLANGARVGTKPQAMIDALLGDLTFDPLEFAKLPAKDQFERVKRLVPGFDFDENNRLRLVAYAERTDANAAAKAARAQAAGITLPPGPKPKDVQAADLIRKLNIATENNNRRASMVAERERFLDEAERLRARATTMEADAAALAKKIDAVPATDTAPIAAELAGAQETARVRRDHEQRERHEVDAAEAEKLSAALSARIEQCDDARRKAVSAAKMPVKGLSFGEDEVLLNGLPFSQAGTAEKLRASVGIAMSLNPDLRVMLVDEGSELDSGSLALVAELAEKHEYQVWICRVDETGKVGFVIEDGALKEATP